MVVITRPSRDAPNAHTAHLRRKSRPTVPKTEPQVVESTDQIPQQGEHSDDPQVKRCLGLDPSLIRRIGVHA